MQIKKITADILFAEQELLKSCGFDLDIESPYQYIDIFFEKNKDLAYMQTYAKNFINDSYRLNICLFYEPIILALSAINLTSKLFKHQLSDQWFACFGDNVEES